MYLRTTVLLKTKGVEVNMLGKSPCINAVHYKSANSNHIDRSTNQCNMSHPAMFLIPRDKSDINISCEPTYLLLRFVKVIIIIAHYF